MQVWEFKAWFEGFTEDMTKLPTTKQWLRIKERIEDIDGVATTERAFINRYWRRYEPFWVNPYPFGTMWSNTTGGMGLASTSGSTNTVSAESLRSPGIESLNAYQTFTALGRAEAASVAA